MELKKSYKGFVIWMIGFFAVMFGCVFLPIEDTAICDSGINCCSGKYNKY